MLSRLSRSLAVRARSSWLGSRPGGATNRPRDMPETTNAGPVVRGALESKLSIVDRELNAALAGTSAWNQRRAPHIRSSFTRMLRTQLVPPSKNTSGPVMEVGSDGQLAGAKILARLTGRHVIATNFDIDGYAAKIGRYPISVQKAVANRLEFDDSTLSLIFGRSVLEHISGLPLFLAECWRVLEPGGVVFLEGGAFWPTPRGHHLAVTGPSGNKYGFDTMPDLIPPWYHLGVDATEMERFLVEDRNIAPEDAEVVARYIYESDEQNRLSVTEIMSMFTDVDFEQVRFDCAAIDMVPPMSQLGGYSNFDLRCHMLAVTARK